MIKRFSMVFLTLLLAVISVLLAAKHPTGPNTVSYDDIINLLLSIGMVVVLFLPPLIMAFFNHIAVKIISAIYQGFIVMSFIVVIPIGFFIPSFAVILIGALGTIVSIGSIIVTIMVGLNNKKTATN